MENAKPDDESIVYSEEDFVWSESESENESSTSMQSSTDQVDAVEEVKKIIKTETQIVLTWRLVVITAMVVASTAVTAATYIFLNNQENNEFESSYKEIASTILDSTSFRIAMIRSSCTNFADQITSAVLLDKYAEWPFFTHEHFAVLANDVRRQTGSVGIWMLPIVGEDEKAQWNNYSIARSDWLMGSAQQKREFIPYIHYHENDRVTASDYPGPYMPVWQIQPLPASSFVNYDMRRSIPNFQHTVDLVGSLGQGVISSSIDFNFIEPIWPFVSKVTGDTNEPFSAYLQPIFKSFNDTATTSKLGGVVQFVLPWGAFFSKVMPESVRGISLVLESTCEDEPRTWELQGKTAIFVGLGDRHLTDYDAYKTQSVINLYENDELATELGACYYTLNVYPTSRFQDNYATSLPIIAAVVVGIVFSSIVAAFLAYDCFQRKRNMKVIANAASSNSLVLSFFPRNIRDRLVETAVKEKKSTAANNIWALASKKKQLTMLLEAEPSPDESEIENTIETTGKPIADFFLETTIMFADITNFTAWSSVREPGDVFTLLETVFGALDKIAKRQGVYKVETVGDCYVAVSGLPNPRKDHALVMAKFARDVLVTVRDLVQRLELTLGPDTGELGIRIGLHSGPVTAGVLRGDRARFQLFGDTMNTTARIESTGQRNRIHISQETASLLAAAGKGHWVKGSNSTSHSSSFDGQPSGDRDLRATIPLPAEVVDKSKLNRLIDWQVDIFVISLKQIVARRNVSSQMSLSGATRMDPSSIEWKPVQGNTCLDEVQEIIKLPDFDSRAARLNEDPKQIDLGQDVKEQLRNFISAVASLYHPNHFHNFAHACHVTMSVKKLLSRIVASADFEDVAASLTDGVPNDILVNEDKELALKYRSKSVAEQNSIDMAWDLLQEKQFKDLRTCIYSNKSELSRFRQLVVQTVLATDIIDNELKELRNTRWDNAFAETEREENPQDTVNRKATIVIEHLIQASDVAHTMQHWHIYRKWNENFFRECYQAYRDGRTNRDPVSYWYKGELRFFDFYIIPLAKKLKKCGVFGVASDEYFNYALKNRQEWEDRGREVVEEMIAAVKQQTEESSHHRSTSDY
ncbi:hypothetical protein ACA910_017895 [Epithemia clementina (nom. ined.)]